MWKNAFAEASSSSQGCALLNNVSRVMEQQASPIGAYGIMRTAAFSFWCYRGQQLFVFLLLLQSATLCIYGLIGKVNESFNNICKTHAIAPYEFQRKIAK